jgi:hypothetical protein
MSDDDDELPGLDPISDAELAELCINVGGPLPTHAPVEPKKWLPGLSERQFEVFFDRSPNLLLQSSRFTGKTWATGYTAVKHAFDYHNALVLIVAKTKRQLLTGGLMSKLGSEILTDFKANITDFEWEGPKLTVEKDVIFRVKNRFGSWSIIQMMSIGNDNDLTRKIKGLEASLVIVDEITLYETPEIYRHLSAVLGRRNHIPPHEQRFLGTCNPDGPSHWVADTWSIMDEEKRDPAFHVIRFLPEDNPDPKVAAYYERLRQSLKTNRTQYQRDIEGLWVDLPKGEAIFKEHFVRAVHVRGDLRTGELLQPQPGHAISVGWDPGDINHGIVFMQEVPTTDRIIWLIFDEIVFVGKKVNLEQLTREVLSRMQHWAEYLEEEPLYHHISDRSAFDRYRAQSGSYDFMEIERHARDNLSKYPKIKRPVKVLECPKPAGSVESRTRIVMDLLSSESVFISAKCVKVIESLERITSKKDNPFAPDTHSQYKHAFDAMTYPLFYYRVGGSGAVSTATDAAMKPQLLRVGT